MLRRVLALFLFTTVVWAGQPEYLPLRPGNQWTYRASRVGNPFTLEIQAAPAGAPAGYFVASGLPGGEVWLRTGDDGTLYAWNAQTRTESVWAAFGTPEGQAYDTSIDPCSKTAIIQSKAAKVDIPIGQFDNALIIRYPPSGCADAGLSSEIYLPYVGLVQRTVTTIAGPAVYDLVYARLNDGLTIITAPEQSVTLALDNVTYAAGAPATARLTVRNTQSRPLRLTFPSGQRYDLAVRDDQGKTVYQWSDGKAFPMIFGTMDLTGERTWLISFPAPGKPGTYQVEAWLATSPVSARGQTSIEVK